MFNNCLIKVVEFAISLVGRSMGPFNRYVTLWEGGRVLSNVTERYANLGGGREGFYGTVT